MRLRIEKAVYGGAGLGHAPADSNESAMDTQAQAIPGKDVAGQGMAGKAIFVPLTLPGELIECEVTEQRRSFANASLVKVLEPSAGRTTPPCEYFPVCGGCHYQHASYAAQLAMKRAILSETLNHAGVGFMEEAIDTLAGEPLGYRNRIRLHIRFGDAALCYRASGSHRDIVVDHCPIAAPLLQQALRLFPEAAQSTQSGLFDEVEFFTNEAQNALLLSLWTTQGTAATQALSILCETLQEALPQLRGALLFQVESQKAQGRQQAAWGDPKLSYRVGDAAPYAPTYAVSGGSFFQVNRFLLPAMLARVTAGQRGRIAWDLYAGAGLFARVLGESFEQVTAVESAASSLRDLRENLKGKRHRVVASSTLDFLMAQVRSNAEQPDFVIVDPPRAGLGKEVTSLLSQIGPRQITYVSCDPATLARDLQWLLHSGYHLRKVTLVDLFPQTFHLETIAELTRA